MKLRLEAEFLVAIVLGINAVFHDPAAALIVDGEIIAAAEEERFSRRKHGKSAVPFSSWELPEQSARFCLEAAGVTPGEVDVVAYSYDPDLAAPLPTRLDRLPESEWEALRTLYARRAPLFLRTALGIDPARVCFVPHHVAHAASAYLAAPFADSSVLVLDGRGEQTSHLSGLARAGDLTVLGGQRLPHSIGLMYESATEHLGFRRASDEYKVMALAAHGRPRFLPRLRKHAEVTEHGFALGPFDWNEYAPARVPFGALNEAHVDLACSVQQLLEELVLELARQLYARTGIARLASAGGVALNCVANARLAREGPFREFFIQPAAGDAGTALGAALYAAHALGDRVRPMTSAALGRSWSDVDVKAFLEGAGIGFEQPEDLAERAAELLAENHVIAWFQGRSEFGPRALGQRSLLADPRPADQQARLNEIKGREEFRPVAPLVLQERAAEIFEGHFPSPFMLFTHRVRDAWRQRIPSALHVDGTARVQTVDPHTEPLLGALLRAFERRTGVPVLINTSFNTAGRPMVDSPADAVECVASAPIPVLVLGPFLIRTGAQR
jgi:carbamoyltransferase